MSDVMTLGGIDVTLECRKGAWGDRRWAIAFHHQYWELGRVDISDDLAKRLQAGDTGMRVDGTKLGTCECCGK